MKIPNKSAKDVEELLKKSPSGTRQILQEKSKLPPPRGSVVRNTKKPPSPKKTPVGRVVRQSSRGR